jgi:putative cell wall-binding protein
MYNQTSHFPTVSHIGSRRSRAIKKQAVYINVLALVLILAFCLKVDGALIKTARAAGSVLITESNGSTDINEIGPITDSYTVALSSQPTDDVVVGVFPNSQQTTDKSILTFTTADWDTPQTVTVAPVQDSLECPHTGLIQHTSASNDANYNVIPIAQVITHIADGCTRILGDNPISQAIAVSKYRFPGTTTAPAAVIARDGVMADAFTAVPFAMLLSAPILLTPSDALNAEVAGELHRVVADSDDPIYILGREQAIAPIVYDQLRAEGFTNLVQIGGTDRRETAAKIARHVIAIQGGAVTRAVITEDEKLIDALGAGAGAGFLGSDLSIDPILLHPRGDTKINPHTAEVLRANPNISQIELIGGTQALPGAIENEIYSNFSTINSVHRSGGEDRFDTNKLIAERFFNDPTGITVANGERVFTTEATSAINSSTETPENEPFFEALLASTVGAQEGFPMLIVRTNSVPAPIIRYIVDHSAMIDTLVIVGDTSQVSQAVEDLIKSFI